MNIAAIVDMEMQLAGYNPDVDLACRSRGLVGRVAEGAGRNKSNSVDS